MSQDSAADDGLTRGKGIKATRDFDAVRHFGLNCNRQEKGDTNMNMSEAYLKTA
jgi:hypothetical protein